MIFGYLKTNRGTTLMETVIYSALVALLTLLTVLTIVSLTKSFKYISATRDIDNSALVSLDRMATEIRQADGLGNGGVFNATSSKLILDYAGVSTTTREFSIASDTALHLYENSVDLGALTSTNLSVVKFLVELATTTSNTAVRITLTLKNIIDSSNPHTTTFYTAAAMRNLY